MNICFMAFVFNWEDFLHLWGNASSLDFVPFAGSYLAATLTTQVFSMGTAYRGYEPRFVRKSCLHVCQLFSPVSLS